MKRNNAVYTKVYEAQWEGQIRRPFKKYLFALALASPANIFFKISSQFFPSMNNTGFRAALERQNGTI